MIDPPRPSASMRAAAAWQPYQVPNRLTCTVRSNSACGSRSGVGPPSPAVPALFTITSTRPKRSQAAATMPST